MAKGRLLPTTPMRLEWVFTLSPFEFGVRRMKHEYDYKYITTADRKKALAGYKFSDS